MRFSTSKIPVLDAKIIVFFQITNFFKQKKHIFCNFLTFFRKKIGKMHDYSIKNSNFAGSN